MRLAESVCLHPQFREDSAAKRAALVRNIVPKPKLGLKSLTANAPKKRDWRDRVAAV